MPQSNINESLKSWEKFAQCFIKIYDVIKEIIQKVRKCDFEIFMALHRRENEEEYSGKKKWSQNLNSTPRYGVQSLFQGKCF